MASPVMFRSRPRKARRGSAIRSTMAVCSASRTIRIAGRTAPSTLERPGRINQGIIVGNVTVIGAQWGDEGKGKIVDWLASRADMVVRFQGGHNAGNTLVVANQTYELSLLPSGIVRGTPSVIGNGVVLDPWALKAEVERMRDMGIEVGPDVLMIAETCPLI